MINVRARKLYQFVTGQYVAQTNWTSRCFIGEGDIHTLNYTVLVLYVKVAEHFDIELSHKIVAEVVQEIKVDIVFIVEASHQHVLLER
jgi:uncharacterized protein YueI